MRDPMFGRGARPYAGGTGWSGSDASKERRDEEDESGVSTHRQTEVLGRLEMAGSTGLTWEELGSALGWHHGQATGALSTLHKVGSIQRLAAERRGGSANGKGSSVYVLPHFVGGRRVARQGRASTNDLQDQVATLSAENARLAAEAREKETLLADTVASLAEIQAALVKVKEIEGQVIGNFRHEVARLTEENHVLRIASALKALDPAETEVLDRVQGVLDLDRNRDRSDDDTVRVYLGTIRELAGALARRR
jgi:hypothetical protein